MLNSNIKKNLKNKELISYLIFGIFTTFVNLFSYIVLTKLFGVEYKTATTAAWILSVLFAFITNKLYVFQSKNTNFKVITKEFGFFVLSRLLSYGLDISSMLLLVGVLETDDLTAKIIANIVVVAFNYVAGKFFVFKSLPRSSNES